jgi:diguanylate cyclase (GGDEF)-like protein
MRRTSFLEAHEGAWARPLAAPPAEPTRHRILVADDNATTRRFLREALELEGYVVSEASGGAEAIEACETEPPNLCIIDLCMSDMHGTAVLARLRRNPETADLPLIVFTGAPEDLSEGTPADVPGFDDLIAKPADADVVLAAVRAHLEPAPMAPPSDRRRVLVVDADLPRSVRTRLVLDRMGFDVTIATGAYEAFRSAQTAPPDAVVADLVLPDGSALELTRRIRADARLATIPVVLTSSAPWSAVQERLGDRAGANAFVALTADVRPLHRAIVHALEDDNGVQADMTPADGPDDQADHLLAELHRQYAEQREVSRQLERGKAELSVLQGLSDVLADVGELDEVLTEGLSRCLHAIGASRGAVFLAEVDGRFSMCSHVGDLGRAPGARIPGNEELFQRVAATGETIVIDTSSGEEAPVPDDVPAPRHHPSTVVTPVGTAGERFGALVVEVPAHEDLRFWMHFLKLVGLGLGFAVANVRRAGGGAAAPDRRDEPLRDGLTGLADEVRLNQELALATASARGERRGALLLLDLDRLRHVNDALGRQTGDELLRGVARRLEGAAGPGTTVARLHSDVFAVLVPAVSGAEGARAVARSILRALDAPVRCNGYTLYTTASIGVTLFPGHAGPPREVLQHAHTAMDVAKERGGNTFELYSNQAGSAVWQRLTVDQGLRAALERDEFSVHYQPIVDLASGRVSAAEALLRWERPVQGLTTAADFITVAEETGVIIPIGAWVLDRTAHEVQGWRLAGTRIDRVSVNVGARELHEADVLGTVSRSLDSAGLDPQALCLEVTETVAMADIARAVRVLTAIRDLGVSIALDDFGTGYSSLRYVQELPLDTLKIDRSFVADAVTDPRSEPILASMIELAHRLGLSVVAEGIETAACLDLVRSLGCDQAQGWHLGRPAPPDEFEGLLLGA